MLVSPPHHVRVDSGCLFQLDGFEGALLQHHGAAASLVRLGELLAGLRGGAPIDYFLRLSADAAAAAEEAAAAAGGGGGAAGGGGAHVDLRLFVSCLAARGHDCWLRAGRAARSSDDGDEGGGDDCGGGGSGDAASGSLRVGSAAPRRRSASASSGAAGSSSHLAPPRHRFAVVRAPPCGGAGPGPWPGGRLLVVDPAFRDQFSVSSITTLDPVYASLVAALPEVAVGDAEGLPPLIAFLCEQMERAFVGSGTPLPPWREAAYVLSSWFPAAAHDEPPGRVSEPGGGGPRSPAGRGRLGPQGAAEAAAAAAAPAAALAGPVAPAAH
ncbi:hypothetical protein Rsub_06914 [Raphidocelis subcapitata]|uniref:Uncharacterized protein n=1 Tax=Raphidocelis subcapitata TaxID=307507 RepID=A0A2V0P5T4_9CHLO|nr:hypothetical protein Rsub_06914 [Raphidocelis subcapitata]|eukprot:GBF94292.1 hypothetical protein Rsub_06914 [Raphidocelis subcapitata]